MTDGPPELRQLQGWMQSVLMHPGGVLEGLRSDASREHMTVDAGEIESVISPSQALSSVDRLEIYARAYYARLIECLRAEYPVLIRAIGEELFDEFAIDYLQRYPSRSYTLGQLGADFARYLQQTRPEEDEAGAETFAWPEVLVDLATLEWNFSEVFDGPGVERQPLLSTSELQSISPQDWANVRLRPTLCLRLVRLNFPVQTYYTALRTDADAIPPVRQETFLAITRRDYVVRHLDLASLEYELLGRIMQGATIGEGIASVASFAGDDLEQLARSLQGWFHRWTAEGFFLPLAAVGEIDEEVSSPHKQA